MTNNPTTHKQWQLENDDRILVSVVIADSNYDSGDYIRITDAQRGGGGVVEIARLHVEEFVAVLREAAAHY